MLKVAPLGGVRALLDIAARIDLPVVVSSALDSAIGIAAGLAAAAALPRLDHACGLGTGSLFSADVADLFPRAGFFDVAPSFPGGRAVPDLRPDPARLTALAAAPARRDWWIARVRACHALLASCG